MSRLTSGTGTMVSPASSQSRRQRARRNHSTTYSMIKEQSTDSGVMTRSRSRLRSSSFFSNEVNALDHRRTSTPLKDSTLSHQTTSNTLLSLPQDDAIVSPDQETPPVCMLQHLFDGLDKDEDSDFSSDMQGERRRQTVIENTMYQRHSGHEEKRNQINYYEYTDDEDTFDMTVDSAHSRKSITTTIIWLIQCIIAIATSVANKVPEALWRTFLTIEALYERVITLHILGDVMIIKLVKDSLFFVVYSIKNGILTIIKKTNLVRFISQSSSSSSSSTDTTDSGQGFVKSSSTVGGATSEDENYNRYSEEQDDDDDIVSERIITTIERTVAEKSGRKTGFACCVFWWIPLIMLGIACSSIFSLYSDDITTPILANVSNNTSEIHEISSTTSNIIEDSELHPPSAPESISLLIREKISQADAVSSEQLTEKEGFQQTIPLMTTCGNCPSRDDIVSMVNLAVEEHHDVWQNKLVLLSEHHMKEVEQLKMDYEKKLGDLQNQLNVMNIFSKENNEETLVSVKTVESEMSTLRNEMRSLMFVLPAEEGKNVNIREYTTSNFKKLKIDLHNLDARLNHLRRDLRSWQSKLDHNWDFSNFIPAPATLFETLTQTSKKQEEIVSDITKLTSSIDVLKDNVTSLQRDVEMLYKSGRDGKEKVQEVINRMNSLENEVVNINSEVRGLKTESISISAKREASIQEDETMALKQAMESLKEEFRELKTDYTERLSTNTADHQVVIQSSFSKLKADVLKAADELDGYKLEMAAIGENVRHKGFADTATRDSFEKLWHQVSVIDGIISSLKQRVAGLYISQGSADTIKDTVETLNNLEYELATCRIGLRNFHHDTNTATVLDSTDIMHSSQQILNEMNSLDTDIASVRVEIRNSLLSQKDTHPGVEVDEEALKEKYLGIQTKLEKFEVRTATLQAELQQFKKELASRLADQYVTSEVVDEIARFQTHIARFESELQVIHTDLDLDSKSQGIPTGFDWVHHLEMQIKALQEDILNTKYSHMDISDVRKLKSDISKMENSLAALKPDLLQLQNSRSVALSREQVPKLSEDFINLNVQVASLRGMLINMKGDSTDQRSELIESMNKLQTEITHFKINLRNTEASSIGGSQSEKLDVENAITAISTLQEELDAILISIRNLQLSENSSFVLEETSKLQLVVENLANNVYRYEEKVKLMHSNMENQDSEMLPLIQKLQVDLSAIKANIEELNPELKKSLRNSDEAYSSFHSTIVNLQADVREIKEKQENLNLTPEFTNIVTSLKASFTELQTEVKNNEFVDVQADVDHLKRELEGLKMNVASGQQILGNVGPLLARLEFMENQVQSFKDSVEQSHESSAGMKAIVTELQSEIHALKADFGQISQNIQYTVTKIISEESSQKSYSSIAIGDIAGLDSALAKIKNDLSYVNKETSTAIHNDYESLAGRISGIETELLTLKGELPSLSSQVTETVLAAWSSRIQNLQSDMTSVRIDVDTLRSMFTAKDKDSSLTDRMSSLEAAVLAMRSSTSESLNLDSDAESVSINIDGSPVKIDKDTLLGLAGGYFARDDGQKIIEDLRLVMADVDGLKEEHLSLLRELHRCCRNETFFKILIRDSVGDILNQIMQEDSDSKFAGWLHGQFVSSEQYQNDLRDLHVRLQELLFIRGVYNYANRTSGAAGGGGGILTGHMTEERIRDIINEALFLFSADKTGMVDYALESAGGSVISTRCSETHESKTALLSIFGIPLWYAANSPRTAIQPDVQPGNCWAFKGTTGYLVIQLSGTIRPTSFSMEHIPKSLSPNGNIDSAPKEFSVWGLENEFQQEGKHLGSYEYDKNGAPLQFFTVKDPDPGVFPMIELKIHGNHGSLEFTCLYRFRVHGVLQKN
ncbi:putative leucine-rich repeat-containing protein DDB_G0290503 [Ptychodera flava]|uniref:putative leucine-rich repeat-containing protein DDB_G0290503 n=1 Tax=Ptychodera flava TaxID=63121 RepID=UPI00396A2EAD